MKTVSVRLNKKEAKVFNEFAKLHDMPLSSLFKKVLIERIEDEIDLKVIKEYEEDLKNDNVELYNFDELAEKLGL